MWSQNRTYLTWLSSGLEAAAFHFVVVWWLLAVLDAHVQRASRGEAAGWLARVAAIASLCVLTRPEGVLMVLATGLMVMWHSAHSMRTRQGLAGNLACALPLVGAPLVYVWQCATYGDWLPNTYYAKTDDVWPEAGWRYAASFVVEYGLWVWLLIAVAWALRAIGGLRTLLVRRPYAVIGVGTVLFMSAYHTVRYGGDHFEYRVYGHFVVLVWMSAVWMLPRIVARPRIVVGGLTLFLVMSWPVQWTHWAMARDAAGFAINKSTVVPIASCFPGVLQPVVRRWDAWQEWLIVRGSCVRYSQHKAFLLAAAQALPSREEGSQIRWDERAVFAQSSVGLAGWVLPHTAIIDVLGLNDRVIARYPRGQAARGYMCHARVPPPGYVDAFRPNVILHGGRAVVLPRRQPLTDEEIRAAEAKNWY